MAEILIIGGASLDILHYAGRTKATAGGAGLYTALAARRSGASVSLYAPRPEPMPDLLQAAAALFSNWDGPVISPDELPRFEISHIGGTTTFLDASFAAETRLSPELLPADLAPFDTVYIIPLGERGLQLDFLRVCRDRGARCIAVGASADIALEQPDVMRALLREADIYFMNRGEAQTFFGSLDKARTMPGKTLYVTLGEGGVLVIQGTLARRVPAVPARELDPTGAGDTFCGATLAHLAIGEHPIRAAEWAMPLAAQVTEAEGPDALLTSDPAPATRLDPRVTVNQEQVERIARLVRTLPEVRPFDFTGSDFPPPDHPETLDFFFATILQQFGFWSTRDGSYHRPLVAIIDGAPRKGSSYTFRAYRRRLESDPEFYKPARQAALTRQEMLAHFRTDDGSDPLPALDLHLAEGQTYGRDMLALNLTPAEIVRQAGSASRPLEAFYRLMDHIGGYKADPLRKKSSLLALILNQRPEAFLTFGHGEEVEPVIDYHLMRSCLRVGLVEVLDPKLQEALIARRVLGSEVEAAVRRAAYVAIEQTVKISGKSMGAVDWFFFNARKRCPEMSEPLCHLCPVDPVCAHRVEFFQPVFRTTAY